MHLHQCLLLLLAVVLLASAPLAAGQHGNEPAFTEQLALAGDQCSLLPSPSMLKHDPTHCGQQNSTLGAQDAYWHALVFNAAFVYSEAQCGSSQGPACMQRGSLELPFTKLAEAIGEAQRTGADLLLLSDIDDDVVFPAGLSVHGRASPVVAKYMNQVYSSSSPTELSGAVTVRSAGGAGVGGAPTMLVGLELSGSIELDGYFGSGVWFASNLVSVPISGDEVSGEVVVTRNVLNLIGAPLFNLNTAGTWMPTANTTVAMTVDCNMIDGATSVVNFVAANRASSVLVDVHDNLFAGPNTVAFNVQFADRLYQRVARNHFANNAVSVVTGYIDEQVVLFGQNMVACPSGTTFSLAGDLIHQATYGTLFYNGGFDSTATAYGQQGMLVAHRDNRHMSSGETISVLAIFVPSELDQSARPSAALSLERNQFIDAATVGTDFATIVRQLPATSPSRGAESLLSTVSNFVVGQGSGSRLASLNTGSNAMPFYSVGHLSAVRSQGDWLDYMNGVQLANAAGGIILASTYSLEVRHAVGDRLYTLADLYVNPATNSYEGNFVFHVLDSVVDQSNSATNAAVTFILPYTLHGGQTDVYIARNRFTFDSVKKRSIGRPQRQQGAYEVDPTVTDPTTIFGPRALGGTKRRSVSVPYTVPYIGGLTFAEDAHHSFVFAENHVSRPGSLGSAAIFDMDDFTFYSSALDSAAGTVVLEAHIDRNYFYTTAGGSDPVAEVSVNPGNIRSSCSTYLSVDNNVFRAAPGAGTEAVQVGLTWQLPEPQQINAHVSASYNSIGHLASGAAVDVFANLAPPAPVGSEHDVYRLNYDCELRGNQIVPQESDATTSLAPIRVYTSMVAITYRAVQFSEHVVVDDNHFGGPLDVVGPGHFVEVNQLAFPYSIIFPARSSLLQSVQMRGNYVAPTASSSTNAFEVSMIATSPNVDQVRVQADLSSNKVAGTMAGSTSAINLNSAVDSDRAESVFRAQDNEIVLNAPFSGGAFAASFAMSTGEADASLSLTNNRALMSGAISSGEDVFYASGFNRVVVDGNQLRGMDDSVQTFDYGFSAQVASSSLPLQATFDNNVVRHVTLNYALAFAGTTTDSSADSSFSVTDNHFRGVDISSDALLGQMILGGSATVCGTLSGNTFLYTSNADAAIGGDLQYDQVAGDGFNVVAGVVCPP